MHLSKHHGGGAALLAFLALMVAAATTLPKLSTVRSKNDDNEKMPLSLNFDHRRRRLEEVDPDNPFNFQTVQPAHVPACTTALDAADIDFTLVTQLSTSRLWILEQQCKRWGQHAMSIAIASNDGNEQSIRRAIRNMGCSDDKTTVTVVYDYDESHFPVNTLRNLAFENVQTSHAVYVDADFLVSPNLYQHLLEQTAVLAESSHQMALLLPAFELRRICDAGDPDCKRMHLGLMPDTKEELMELLGFPQVNQSRAETPPIIPFDFKINPGGHNSTRFMDWLDPTTNNHQDELLDIECILAPERFEPYVVVRYCRDMPPFQEAFAGYGKNKVTWWQHLRRAGYTLKQLPNAFCVHFPHPKSQSFKTWAKVFKKEGHAGLEIDKVYRHFMEWLDTQVPDETAIATCPDAYIPTPEEEQREEARSADEKTKEEEEEEATTADWKVAKFKKAQTRIIKHNTAVQARHGNERRRKTTEGTKKKRKMKENKDQQQVSSSKLEWIHKQQQKAANAVAQSSVSITI